MNEDPPASGMASSASGNSAADRLLARKRRILSIWQERVRREIAAAAKEPEPILVNTLPALLRQLAEAMSPRHPRRTATEGATLAEEHGSERVRVTSYRLDDVIAEYRILREVVFAELEASGSITVEERNTIHSSLDESIMKACTAYTLVQDRMREQVAATLAHDLRSPLTSARASAQLILRRPDSEDTIRWAARVIDSLDRADRMVQDLLDVMRLHTAGRLPLKVERCDLVDLVQQAISHLESEHGPRFVLAAPTPVVGHFAPEPLRRACENLGANAVKYGSESRAITFTVRENNGRAFVMVHNHGEAIPASQQETIFRTFERATRAEASDKKGWGLGLAQVRGVAEAHGGSIGVDSLPEKGTTFTLDIPLDARPLQDRPTLKGSRAKDAPQ